MKYRDGSFPFISVKPHMKGSNFVPLNNSHCIPFKKKTQVLLDLVNIIKLTKYSNRNNEANKTPETESKHPTTL